MRNKIAVHFGDNLESIFYWYNVDTLPKLKESIKKRFGIHPDHQTIKHGGNVLDEEYFEESYKKRFAENLRFNVQITEQYPGVIGQRREDICKEKPTFQVEIPRYHKHKPIKTIDFRTKAVWTIAHLKQSIHKKIKLDVDNVVLGLEKNPSVILADNHLIADLLLDLDKGGSLRFNLTLIRPTERVEYYLLLSPVKIIIPYLDRNIEVDYPLIEIGCLGTSVLKSWVEATFKIPYEEQEVIHQGVIIQNEFFPRDAWFIRHEHELNPIRVKLLAYSTSNETLNSLYRRLEIKTILPVDLSSFGTSDVWHYHYGRGINQDLKKRLSKIHYRFQNVSRGCL